MGHIFAQTSEASESSVAFVCVCDRPEALYFGESLIIGIFGQSAICIGVRLKQEAVAQDKCFIQVKFFSSTRAACFYPLSYDSGFGTALGRSKKFFDGF